MAKLYGYKDEATLRNKCVYKLEKLGQWPLKDPVNLLNKLAASFSVKR